MKLGLIGAGHVGEIVAYTAAIRGLADQIVFHDINRERMRSESLDIVDGSLFYPHRVQATFGDHEDLVDCDIIVVCSGLIPEEGDRLYEFELNKDAVASYTKSVVEKGFDGYFIVVTNPCDIITYQVLRSSGFPANKVIGSGTALDSARFCAMLAERLNLAPSAVTGLMLGEHGESQFTPWSQVKVGPYPFDRFMEKYPEALPNFDKDAFEADVRGRGWEVFKGKQSTQYGIANTVNAIIRAIIHDTREILCVSAHLDGEYGLEDLYISTPCVIGAHGIEEVLELDLTDEELKRYHDSAKVIKEHIERL